MCGAMGGGMMPHSVIQYDFGRGVTPFSDFQMVFEAHLTRITIFVLWTVAAAHTRTQVPIPYGIPPPRGRTV